MFSVEWGEDVPGHVSGVNGRILLENGDDFCSVHTWGFASCACYTLQGFHGYTSLSEKEADEFFKFLCEEKPPSGWLPTEMYFLLTPPQVATQIALVTHPNVRKVDSFTNKAHGGRLLSLYRYSKQMDFKS